MSKAWEYAKKGLKAGALAGAIMGAIGGIFGGGIIAGVIAGAICWGITGIIIGAAIGVFTKDNVPTPAPSESAKIGRSATPSLEPALSQQQEQASTRFQDQEAARRQVMAVAQTR